MVQQTIKLERHVLMFDAYATAVIRSVTSLWTFVLLCKFVGLNKFYRKAGGYSSTAPMGALVTNQVR